MTCLRPDYEPEEINRIQDLERLLKETKAEGLGPACLPIRSAAEKTESPKPDLPIPPAPCPLYSVNSAALYRKPGEEI